MLNPSVDRLDYGEKLQAPEGFQLSYAVATSYSLSSIPCCAYPWHCP